MIMKPKIFALRFKNNTNDSLNNKNYPLPSLSSSLLSSEFNINHHNNNNNSMHCENSNKKLLHSNINRLNSNSNSRSPSPATSSCSQTASLFKNSLNQQHLNENQQLKLTQTKSSVSPNLFSAPYPPTSSIYSIPPITCEARQLNKLKRFLTTIQQFANDVSAETSERVRSLILNLVNSNITIEDFHARLHEATNFPLRPFVIPFLRASLPLLQRELSYLSRLEKQNFIPSSGSLYDQLNLSLSINNMSTTSLNPFISSSSSPKHQLPNNENILNGKRKSPIDCHQSDCSLQPPPIKRNAPSPINSNQSPNKIQNHQTHLPSLQSQNYLFSSTQLNLDDLNFWRELREKERFFSNYIKDFEQDYRELFDRNFDDDYKNIDTLLNCFSELIDKTKRSMNSLHSKTQQLRKQVETYESEIKRKHCEILSQTMKQTEDRVNEIKKRAEDAVNEVKKQAAIELQKAIQAAEQKANEIVKKEQEIYEHLLKQKQEDVVQENNIENCWNCGRKANEPCRNCHQAKYCSQFCRQKHWEHGHYDTCTNDKQEVKLNESDLDNSNESIDLTSNKQTSISNNNKQSLNSSNSSNTTSTILSQNSNDA